MEKMNNGALSPESYVKVLAEEKSLRVLLKYTSVLQATLFCKRRHLDENNTFHIKDAIRTTKREISQLRKEISYQNYQQLFDQYDKTIRTVEQYSDPKYGEILDRIERVFNYALFDSVISNNDRIGDRTSQMLHFPLVLSGQLPPGQYATIAPRTFFTTGGGLLCSPTPTPVVVLNNMKMNFRSDLWYNFLAAFCSDDSKLLQKRADIDVEDCWNIVQVLSIPYYPSAKTEVGITRFDCTSISNFLDAHEAIDMTFVYPGPARSLEAIEDGEEDEADDDTEPDTAEDDDTDSGDDDFGGDDTNVDDDDMSSDDEASGDGDDSLADEDGQETEEKPVLYDLAKDETVDDLVYKLAILHYIDSIDRNKVDANELAALVLWKNAFLFVLSVDTTERFLKSVNHKVPRP